MAKTIDFGKIAKRNKLNEDMLREYAVLAKRADTRMRRLEDLSKKDSIYEGAKAYAYLRAQDDLKKWATQAKLDSGKPLRFDVKNVKSQKELEMRLKDVKRFLKSKTSTPKGIRDKYQKTVETIKKNYGVDMTPEQLANYFESGIAKKFDEKYGSKTALNALGIIQKSKTETAKELKKSMETIETGADDVIKQKAIKMFRYYNKKVKDILQ